MSSSRKKVFVFGLSAIILLGVAYWIIGLIQYRLNVMDVENYDPISTLHVDEHHPHRARFPFIDVHSHQWIMPIQNLDKLVVEMDSLNMGVMVNLSGFRGKLLEWSLENVAENQPRRFAVFINLDMESLDDDGWPQTAIDQLNEGVRQGARGLKVYKGLGLTDRDNEGKRIAIDDSRLDPIWKRCGELGIPVLIHSGEPVSFWEPKDKHNERWLELKQEPDRYRPVEKFASFEDILEEQHTIFRRHPKTKFIAAHLDWLGNDLKRLGHLLDTMPNVYTELGAVLAELGRQPLAARDFLIQYQDRVMLGKDTYKKEEYYTYFRVLETNDEYFDYYRKRHAHWKMYGLNLPDSVLKKIYYKNALVVIPNLDTTLFTSADKINSIR